MQIATIPAQIYLLSSESNTSYVSTRDPGGDAEQIFNGNQKLYSVGNCVPLENDGSKKHGHHAFRKIEPPQCTSFLCVGIISNS